MAVPMVNPYEEILRLKKSVDKLFESMNTETEVSDLRMPAIELLDEKENLVLVVELPGMKKEDVKVEVGETAVSIRAERIFEEDKENKKKTYYYSERQYTAFYRVIPLPIEVDPTSVKAKYANGVLEVRMKKAPQKKNVKEIKVD
jgi:HSP20 family protein